MDGDPEEEKPAELICVKDVDVLSICTGKVETNEVSILYAVEELLYAIDATGNTLDAYGELLVDPGWITDDVDCKVVPATAIILDESDDWVDCIEDDNGAKIGRVELAIELIVSCEVEITTLKLLLKPLDDSKR